MSDMEERYRHSLRFEDLPPGRGRGMMLTDKGAKLSGCCGRRFNEGRWGHERKGSNLLGNKVSQERLQWVGNLRSES